MMLNTHDGKDTVNQSAKNTTMRKLVRWDPETNFDLAFAKVCDEIQLSEASLKSTTTIWKQLDPKMYSLVVTELSFKIYTFWVEKMSNDDFFRDDIEWLQVWNRHNCMLYI